MIWNARELLIHLTYLQLWGQTEEGNLEWVGKDEQWKKVTWALDGSPVYDPTHPDYYKESLKQ
jgi:hypothetical protein